MARALQVWQGSQMVAAVEKYWSIRIVYPASLGHAVVDWPLRVFQQLHSVGTQAPPAREAASSAFSFSTTTYQKKEKSLMRKSSAAKARRELAHVRLRWGGDEDHVPDQRKHPGKSDLACRKRNIEIYFPTPPEKRAEFLYTLVKRSAELLFTKAPFASSPDTKEATVCGELSVQCLQGW
jgi:hypothetical protein